MRGQRVASTEESYLLDCSEQVVCPYCHKEFPETARVGSGQKRMGGFCSLDCYARYYELDIRDRLKRFVDANENNK